MDNGIINIIWENKGILLGIILFILKNFDSLENDFAVLE